MITQPLKLFRLLKHLALTPSSKRIIRKIRIRRHPMRRFWLWRTHGPTSTMRHRTRLNDGARLNSTRLSRRRIAVNIIARIAVLFMTSLQVAMLVKIIAAKMGNVARVGCAGLLLGVVYWVVVIAEDIAGETDRDVAALSTAIYPSGQGGVDSHWCHALRT